VRVEPARTDIGLIPGSIHIIDKNAGNFAEHLTGNLLGYSGIQILYTHHLIFFSRPYKATGDWLELEAVFPLSGYGELAERSGHNSVLYLCACIKRSQYHTQQ
jgi:hypothetical protein